MAKADRVSTELKAMNLDPIVTCLGRVDPVRLDSNDFKMGLGKNTEYNYYATEATKAS